MSIRSTRVLCARTFAASVHDFAAELRTMKPKQTPKPKGRFQWWKEPVYCAPHVHPLRRGVDFTYQDGRPLFVSSKDELKRKLEQIELGKKVVKLLGEIREAESLHADELRRREEEALKLQSLRPIAKGDQSIC
ncbi:unnamed protein product [Anisakis simplex]|uniref:39S ribosomal protein L52, mitochondrial n=1 Tax=Anisakis simplex TaxID=6269 RepID=A0A0M3JYU7_ANISI|nr:unnamed protein product [Anisakis simplex]